MEEGKLLAVFIGIIGALIGVYFRESIKKAQARLKAAVVLESTLYHWIYTGMENPMVKELLITGYAYGEKEREVILSKDINKIEEFRKKLESVLVEQKEKFMKEQEANVEKIAADIKSLSKEEYAELIRAIDDSRNEMGRENYFLNEDQISVLDWHKLPAILEVKSEMQSLLFDVKLALIHIYTNEKIDKERFSNLIFSMIKSALKLSKNILPLMQYSKNIREKGLLGNMLS